MDGLLDLPPSPLAELADRHRRDAAEYRRMAETPGLTPDSVTEMLTLARRSDRLADKAWPPAGVSWWSVPAPDTIP